MGGSAPLRLVHGRPVVDLDGGVPALVDTAGAAILLSQALADRWDLAVVETIEERGEVFTVLEPPALTVAGYELDTDGLPAYGFEDTRRLGLAASGLELLLPATLLARHAVALDLAGGSAWFGDAGSLAGSAPGVRVPATRAAGTRLVTVEAEVLGTRLSLLLDTGVSCSLAADRVVRSWLASVPDLPTSAAAVGPGNMAGLPVEARTPMVRVPEVAWAGFTLPGVAFVWRGDADVAPTDGSLGGNVLRWFALGLDGDSLWVEQRAPVEVGGDADQVGVTLVLGDGDGDAAWHRSGAGGEGGGGGAGGRGVGAGGDDPSGAGARGAGGASGGGGGGPWIVGATVSGLAPAVQAGDEVVSIDGWTATGAPISEVLARLRGEVGATFHHLVLRRGASAGGAGALVEADAPVVRVL